MKVLFDNNVPAPLRNRLAEHTVDTAQKIGWQELKNGELLAAAEAAGFDVLVAGDRHVPAKFRRLGPHGSHSHPAC